MTNYYVYGRDNENDGAKVYARRGDNGALWLSNRVEATAFTALGATEAAERLKASFAGRSWLKDVGIEPGDKESKS